MGLDDGAVICQVELAVSPVGPANGSSVSRSSPFSSAGSKSAAAPLLLCHLLTLLNIIDLWYRFPPIPNNRIRSRARAISFCNCHSTSSSSHKIRKSSTPPPPRRTGEHIPGGNPSQSPTQTRPAAGGALIT